VRIYRKKKEIKETILVIDDSPTILKIITGTLAKGGEN